MYGTFAGALSGRKIPYDRDRFTATVDGRIAGSRQTIRIHTIVVHYTLEIEPEHREAAERALRVHPRGCPVHESIGSSIPITWDAVLHIGDEVIHLRSNDVDD